MGVAPEDGLPTGLQLMAPAYEDHRLYHWGSALERLIQERDGSLLSENAPEVI
jgi:aspartyl-tRNA(Asn)/glutamyl-tRNA(Gln) amidotransferase subunit A